MSNMEPLTSFEMKALSGVVSMECIEETKAMVDYAKKRKMPDPESQEKLMACWSNTNTKSISHCGEDFNKLVACLDKNERVTLKCANLRKVYEECYVKQVMLKDQK